MNDDYTAKVIFAPFIVAQNFHLDRVAPLFHRTAGLLAGLRLGRRRGFVFFFLVGSPLGSLPQAVDTINRAAIVT